MERFINYLKDTRTELAHVTWPTQKQSTVYTILVIVISVFIAGCIGVFDYIFTGGVDWFIH